MGKPFAHEIKLLADTYRWALAYDVGSLADAVWALRGQPLLAIGSGGSLSAAAFAADLHEAYARLPAKGLTPLEFLQHPRPQAAGVLLLSAGGSNRDVLAAAQHAIENEYAPVLAITNHSGSKLARYLRNYRHCLPFEFDGPAGKDGFLATNSLLLTCTLLARAYDCPLPEQLPAFSVIGPTRDTAIVESFRGRPLPKHALRRSNVIVIRDIWCRSAALDLECKWAEAGFGTVLSTDARNFAHGRHVGLDRRIGDTLVLGLTVARETGEPRPNDPELNPVLRTLNRLPEEAVTALVRSPLVAGAGALDLIVRVIGLAGHVGRMLAVDPGRPKVPFFGRKLYHDGVGVSLSSARSRLPSMLDVWIERKVTPQGWAGASQATRDTWRSHATDWKRAAEVRIIGGAVIDYDGTLCEAHERCQGPSKAVAVALTQLVEGGLILGIATGRGDGVLTGLRNVLPPSLWHRVLVGMYSGSMLLRLSDSPALPSCQVEAVRTAREILDASPVVSQVACFRLGSSQLTVLPARPLPEGLLERLVKEALLHMAPALKLSIMGSDHSVDIVPRESSKLAVVTAVQELLAQLGGAGRDVMTVGDQGQVGGNDWDLLARPTGISVDRVSSRFDGCWNVAAPGARRTDALMGFLGALHSRPSGGFRWRPGSAYRLSAGGSFRARMSEADL